MILIATIDDAPAIADIWNEVIRDPAISFTTREKTSGCLREMIENRPVFIAQGKTDILGFVTYSDFRQGTGYKHTAELSIHLASHARGRGLGRGLMKTVLDHAGDH